MDGLNGDPVFTAKDVVVGKVDAQPYGYKRGRVVVTVDVRMERLTRQATYETTDHRQVRRPMDFALTTGVWNRPRTDWLSGGATLEPLENLVEHLNGFTPDLVAELVWLGGWHLNSLNAACDHQVVVGKTTDEHLNLTDPCPVSGYRYGRSWLVRELPTDFLSRVRAVFAHANDQSGIYDAEAEHDG